MIIESCVYGTRGRENRFIFGKKKTTFAPQYKLKTLTCSFEKNQSVRSFPFSVPTFSMKNFHMQYIDV